MHRIPDGQPFPWKLAGTYPRLQDGRRVQRFFCKTCGQTFSQQSFSATYYLKKARLLPQVAAGLNAGSAHRQIARTLGCAPSTVTRLSARLGRHSLLLQELALQELTALDEDLVADHFETFTNSQLDALGVATLVGHASWFVYALDPAPHRRGGRITPAQREKAAKRRKTPIPRGSVTRSFRRILDLIQEKLPREATIVLNTDKNPAYVSAFAGHPVSSRVSHRVHPNPPRGPKGSPRSAVARERDEAMFAVDMLHGLLRHTCAAHSRETISFGRRVNAVMERLFLTGIWRNFVKWRSERKPDRTTPAMRLGLTDRPWSWARVLAQRLFVDRVGPSESWMKIYRRDWITPAVGRNVRHRLKHAF